MYTICRQILITTVVATVVFVAVLTAKFGNVVLIVFGIAGVVEVFRWMRHGKLYAFGTARWARVSDVRKAGLTTGHGLILGTLYDSVRPSTLSAILGLINPLKRSADAANDFLRAIFPRIRGNLPVVRLSRAVHTAIFAPTGVGKGVSCAIPFLMDCPDSCRVIDFKGELARATMKHRRRIGQRIVLLDAYRLVTERPDSLNPLDFIEADSPHMMDECRDLAESLVNRTGQEREPHWVDSAEAWITAAIATVVQFGDADDRSLQTVRRLLASSPENLNGMIKLLCESDACDGMLSRLGYQLTQFKDKELTSTLTTANRFLRFLDTPAIAAVTTSSSFDPSRQEKSTVYLVLPPEHARAQSPLLRMWISALLRGALRGGLQEQNRVHFLLDESASLGHLDCLDDAVDKYRGYGVRLTFVYQSLGQLKKCFPEGQDQTLLSNVTQVFFGVNDLPTAEYVSNRLGDETIVVESGGSSWGGSRQHSYNSQGENSNNGRSWNTTSNWQQQGRRLLKPDEVMALPPRTAITFAAGLPPICTRLTRYYEGRPDAWWRRLMQATRANVYAVAALAAVMFGTKIVQDMHNQPKLQQPRIVPGVPDRRLPLKGERYAIRRENAAIAWPSR